MVSWLLSTLLLTAVAGQSDCTIVYFGSVNCAPCEQMKPVLTQLKQEGWDIRPVDASQDAKLAQLYRIQNLPTLVVVCNNKEVDRIVGAVSYEQLSDRFTRAAARTQGSALVGSPALGQQTIVRGQSPSSGGFPMLASDASAFGADASEPAVMQALHTQPAAPTMEESYAQAAPTSLAAHAAPPQRLPNTPLASRLPSLTVDQAIARAADATVRIKVEEANTTAYGTGTIIDVHGREALILTCGHLFRDMKPGSQLTVDLFAGTPREINVFAQLIDYKAEEEDIGLLSFELPVAIEPVEILPRNQNLQIRQPVFSFGCDHGQDPTRRDTQIRNVNRYLGAANVEIQGAPAVGRSGGGLFDLQGRLIGVCNAADAEGDEGIYAAAEVVYTQIERLGLSHLFDQSQSVPEARLASSELPNAVGQPSAAGQFRAPVQSASFPQHSVLGQRADFAQPSSTPNPSDWNSRPASPQLTGDSAAQEIICIVRDGSGQSRIMTISGPSPELLRTIEQNAR